MDLLSRVLSIVPIGGVLDERCHFSAPWEIAQSEAASWVIPYHVVLSGNALVEDEGGRTEVLNEGDVVIFPTGRGHRLHGGKEAGPVLTASDNEGKRQPKNPHATSRAEILCGRFLIGAIPDQLLRHYLPDQLIVRNAANVYGVDKQAERNTEAAADAERLTGLVGLMTQEVMRGGPGSKTLLSHLSAALFALVLRCASLGPNPPSGLLALAAHPRLHGAMSAMFDEPEKAWTLDDLASRCNMSKATFVRQFQGAIGRSAMDVLLDIRMTLAGKLLLESQRSISEVSEMVGYQSVAAFHRAFKRTIGTNPAQYREAAEPGEG